MKGTCPTPKSFAVLAINPDSKSTNRFLEEGKKRGHEMFVLDPKDIIINTDRKGKMTIYSGSEKENKKIDGVISRIGGSQRGLEILHALCHNLGIKSTTTPYGVRHAGNKNLSQYLIAEHKKMQPKTSNINIGGLPFDMLMDSVGGIPCIMKTSTGSQGSGVYLFNDEIQSKNTLYNFKKQDVKGLIQEFVETSKPKEPKSDIRVIVVDGVVIASMKRFSLDDDVRSNYTISGKAEKVELSQGEVNLCIELAKIFKLPYTGIDIMREAQTGDTLICEINSCPGLGIEDVTGNNVAREVIKYLERETDNEWKTKPILTKTNQRTMIYGSAQLSHDNLDNSYWGRMDKKYGMRK